MESVSTSSLTVVECNLDDLNPQLIPHLIELLLGAGARDAWATPILMKKGRPGFTLSALCHEAILPQIRRIFFAESTSLGLREYPVVRHELERELREVTTEFGPVTLKLGKDQAGRVVNVFPEYESCAAVARDRGVPLKEVARAAMAGWARENG